MAVRTFAIATAVMLGLTGLAQGQGRTWQEPGSARDTNGPAAPMPGSQTPVTQVPVRQAQAAQAQPVQPPQGQATQAPADPQRARTEPSPRAEAARPRVRAERRPRDYRSARYRGGEGASWKTGRDAYGFMGSYGGCSYRGHAGPGGYRLDRRC